MMSNKKKIIILGSIIIGVIALSLVLLLIFKKDDTETPKADSFVSSISDIVFTNISDSINLGEVMPTLDKFGRLNDSFLFTIKNNGKEEKHYVLSLYDNNSTILNKMIRYELIKNRESLGIHTLSDDGVIDFGTIKKREEISYSLKLWLSYDSDVQIGKINKKIMISEQESYLDNSNANVPIMLDNLIPVYYDYESLSFYKSSMTNTYYDTWYNYEKEMYANAVTVKNEKFKEYQDSKSGTRIDMSDVTSMWVWIPRFSYRVDNKKVSIKYVDVTEEAHPSFTFNGKELKGFWISKYEAGIDSDDECITYSVTSKCNDADKNLLFKPNIPIMNRITMANLFYAIRKMELRDNIYGFSGNGINVNNDGTINGDDNNLDIHMIRNSEWEAVSLLSYKNTIVSNNTNITGMAFYNDKSYNYDIITYGEMASTTNNITGVYDMVGGKCEFVMLKDDELFTKLSNSGFANNIKDYYYDTKINEDMSSIEKKDNISFPATRGGYGSIADNVLSFCNISDYVNKVSLETNSRAVLDVFEKERK